MLIHRDGKAIDVLGEGQTFSVLRREQNLEQAMLDGTLTANLFPEGLQVGDVLEFATTLSSNNPVTGSHAESVIGPLNFAAGRVDVTLSWPEGAAMQLDRSGDLPEWKRSRRGGFEFAELHLRDIQPILLPRGAPERYAVARIGQATDYGSWSEVSRLFVPLYAEAAAIPAEGPLRAEVEKIRAASGDPTVRVEKALALVQERVRYVALLSGLGGLVPASAVETWSRRYGDCKGKTALLMGILAELGIQSEPVLVSTGLGDMLGGMLPAVGLFDHVILRAAVEGREYWLDGTRRVIHRLRDCRCLISAGAFLSVKALSWCGLFPRRSNNRPRTSPSNSTPAKASMAKCPRSSKSSFAAIRPWPCTMASHR